MDDESEDSLEDSTTLADLATRLETLQLDMIAGQSFLAILAGCLIREMPAEQRAEIAAKMNQLANRDRHALAMVDEFLETAMLDQI